MQSLDTPTMETNRNVPASAIDYIGKSGKWMRILAVIGFIFVGLMLLVSIFILAAGSQIGASSGMDTSTLGIFYLVMAALYIYPTVLLWRSGNNFKRYAERSNETDIEIAFMQQANMFQFIGVITIIFIGLGIIMVLAGGAYMFAS